MESKREVCVRELAERPVHHAQGVIPALVPRRRRRPTTVADLFRTCGHQPGKGTGENKDTPDRDPPLGALRLPRMDGACSTCLHTVTGANTEPQHWAAWWARHAATAALEALAAAAAAAASQAAAPASRSAAAALAKRSGAAGTSQLLGWAHPMAAYDIWGKSDLPDMWDQVRTGRRARKEGGLW